jgi:hypothetical protein
MSFKKFANAVMEDPSIQVHDWEAMHAGQRVFTGVKTAAVKKLAANSTRYLLTHCTIMSSVMTEPEPEDHLIKPECSHLVNNNDDAWSNEVLKMSHKSFVGAFNFVEHFQNSKYAKGHILDAVLRKIGVMPDGTISPNAASDVWVYFADILVATDMSHERLVTDIRDSKVKYLSMGCVTDLVICSFCGARVTDQGAYCNHLAYQKGTFIPDENGIYRRIAELCGHKSLPNGGVKFVEASWVATPAFPGASKRSVVAEGWLGPGTPYTQEAEVQASSEKEEFAKAASLNDSDFLPLSVEIEQIARRLRKK